MRANYICLTVSGCRCFDSEFRCELGDGMD
jgi:hypothetical protein